MTDFQSWFTRVTDVESPHPWQTRLARDPIVRSRMLRIPTGLGKTAGVVLAWLWNRVVRDDDAWPRRLVFCLPMRVLVEQTEAEIRRFLERDGRLCGPGDSPAKRVAVHLLMGGADAEEWYLRPDQNAVLVGTQDMLLSRALNRGYASPRARWPMEFGLLNQDCLWILDEIQLMDVGLLTSAQLQAFRHSDASSGKGLRPCHSWWMSATTQEWWLNTVDTRPELLPGLPPTLDIAPDERHGILWQVQRSLRVQTGADPRKLANLVAAQHRPGTITLAVLNEVKRAAAVYDAVLKKVERSQVDVRLVHSRFRPQERQTWRDGFLRRGAELPPEGRIIVATQVVEAGVDISATTLVTDLAPWASLVQRFGRCARYEGKGDIVVVDRELDADDDRAAAPYRGTELAAAGQALEGLASAGPVDLAAFEAGLSEAERAKLYPYEPLHRLTRRELEELFDTTPDLTGADIDISRFIRSGDERDLLVAWLALDARQTPPDDLQPPRAALCPVPFLAARDWLTGAEARKKRRRAWVWDFVDGAWRRVGSARELYPGRTVVVAADAGGYDPERGFDPTAGPMAPEAIVPWTAGSEQDRADAAQDGEDLSEFPRKTIATHGREVAAEVAQIGTAVGLPADLNAALTCAGRWHDAGKAHPAFQSCIREAGTGELAKAQQWAPRADLYRYRDGDQEEWRPGFRHELASAAALFAVLRVCSPQHSALLGELAEFLDQAGLAPASADDDPLPPDPLVDEIVAFERGRFDLLAFLVCAHHGKVRASWHAAPADQNYRDRDGRGLPIRGLRDGDVLSTFRLSGADGVPHRLERLTLRLDPAAIGLSPRFGRSWSERVAGLLAEHGPFALAWMEAILRAADVRASRLNTVDPLLEQVR